MSGIAILFAMLLALALDYWLGEPKKYHPLVGFGRLAGLVEPRMRQLDFGNQRLQGLLAWLLLVITPVLILLALLISLPDLLDWFVSVLVLYLAIGWRSLQQHAQQVEKPLQQGNLEAARAAVSRIVSRDTQQLDQQQVASAAVESVLENGSDAVIAPLFWFLVAGAPGVLLYRLVNTLDAMWGYRNARYQDFGYVAAKADDVLNWLPARICALGYALMGNFTESWQAMRLQGPQTDSPNAGWVMAAGAGALGIQAGGATSHAGDLQQRPQFGLGRAVQDTDIAGAVALLQRSVLFWLSFVLAVGALSALS